MAAGTPLTRLMLSATSVADDLGYVALSDLTRALGDIAADFRVIGGHMVTVLAARWHLGHELYRETGDVDLGIPPVVARCIILINAGQLGFLLAHLLHDIFENFLVHGRWQRRSRQHLVDDRCGES